VIILSGADLVLPDRILASGTLIIEGSRIAEVRAGAAAAGGPDPPPSLHGHYVVPGFVDAHVHGVDGVDTLDAGDAIASIAARLPRYGVTAFCPTTVACAPVALRRSLDQVRRARTNPQACAARVLPAHLESSFISPKYSGAQPAGCLRGPREALGQTPPEDRSRHPHEGERREDSQQFAAADVLDEIERAASDVGTVTVAPELDGSLDLIRWLTARGHRVSLGHSGATYDEALAAIASGAHQATHLFNRMPPLDHHAPGLAGAVLDSDEVVAELICDGHHVHPAFIRMAVAAKQPSRVMAITDGTAASGLPVGRRAFLGGQPITAGKSAAFLDDGSLAGSVLTMDRAFQLLVGCVGLSLVEATTICATTPARQAGLTHHGVIAAGAVADVVVLDARYSVVQTYVEGQLTYSKR
jgi:N-acetylglucosamine-6-phosphate deacetylase